MHFSAQKFKSLQQTLAIENACLVDGQWLTSSKTIEVENPAQAEVITTIPVLSSEQIDFAIACANKAFTTFAYTQAAERAELLERLANEIRQNQNALAQLITLEMGKPLAEAQAEITIGANYLAWFAAEARRNYGDIIPSPWPNSQLQVTKEAVGPVGIITPWNFPHSMITRKLGALIAAGCTCVIKPSELTPLSAIAIAALAKKSGFPDGVINVITGDAKTIGERFSAHPSIKKLSFTGSTGVGKLLAQNAGAQMKMISLELGGNAPFIIFDDANIDAAIEGIIASKFRNSGQTCICANRILVQESITENLVEKLKEAIAKLKTGDGFDVQTTQGPLISANAVTKVQAHVDDIIEKGGEILIGGESEGNFYQPTLAINVTTEMNVWREETFGPLAAITTFTDEAQAIALANNTGPDLTAGLAAYFYARDHARIHRVNRALNFGMVGVNTGAISSEAAPFGGRNDSGFGSEGSKYGIQEYQNLKTSVIGGLND